MLRVPVWSGSSGLLPLYQRVLASSMVVLFRTESEWKNLTDLLNNVVEARGIPGISMITIIDGRIDQIGRSSGNNIRYSRYPNTTSAQGVSIVADLLFS